MNDPKWPKYHAGPRDSIFAMGVASGNYARLEITIAKMVATLTGISNDTALFFLAKTKNLETALAIMRQALTEHTDWPEPITSAVSAFLSALKICGDNRNLLMHSNIFASDYEPALLFKINREVQLTICTPTLNELRQVADDIRAYTIFGRELSDSINARRGDWTSAPTSQIPLPNIPAPPQLLQYKTNLRVNA